MPPRSVCLNVFTSSLGEAVRDDGAVPTRHPIMERRDSAQSGVYRLSLHLRGVVDQVCDS